MLTRDHLTASEQHRMFGVVQGRALEELLDNADLAEGTSGVAAHIQEARGSIPGEDFMSVEVDELRSIAKRLRGDNKKDLQALIERIEGKLTEQQQSGEYGLDELRKAEKLLIGTE